MLRKLKTNITKEDLIRPTVDINAAGASMQSENSSAGGLVLPVQADVVQALRQAPKAVSDDWKKVGDPTAPAIKEMEAIKLMEKQQAEAAAKAQPMAAMPQMPGLGGAQGLVMDIVPPPVVNAPTSADDHTRQPYAWMPKPAVSAAPKPDDIPDIWSRPSPLDNMTIPTSVPAGFVPKPAQPVVPADLSTPMADSASRPPTVSGPQSFSTPTEGVIYIPHDPSKTIKPAVTITSPAPSPTEGDFASGAAVTIPHDSNLQSLPYYSPPTTKPKLTEAVI